MHKPFPWAGTVKLQPGGWWGSFYRADYQAEMQTGSLQRHFVPLRGTGTSASMAQHEPSSQPAKQPSGRQKATSLPLASPAQQASFQPAHYQGSRVLQGSICHSGASLARILLSAGPGSWKRLLSWEISLYPELLFNKDFRQLQRDKPCLLPGEGLLGCRQIFPAGCKGSLPTCWEHSGKNSLPKLPCMSPWGLLCAHPPPCPNPAAGADSFKELFIDNETSVFPS